MTYIQLAWKIRRTEVKIKAFSIYDNWHYNLKVIKKNMHVYFVLIISFINTRSTNAKKISDLKKSIFFLSIDIALRNLMSCI